MEQEIDIKLNVIFLQRQVRESNSELNVEIEFHLRSMKIVELESSINNMHIRFTTSIDAKHDEPEISRIIGNKIKDLLPWGVLKIETLSLKEEAEIYGNI